MVIKHETYGTSIAPYPGALDSAAAYFTLYQWYLEQPQTCTIDAFYRTHDDPAVNVRLVPWEGVTRVFTGHTLQECLYKLHTWVTNEENI